MQSGDWQNGVQISKFIFPKANLFTFVLPFEPFVAFLLSEVQQTYRWVLLIRSTGLAKRIIISLGNQVQVDSISRGAAFSVHVQTGPIFT
jgi:hypothetical protein